MQISTLHSYQYSNNTVHLGVREMQAVFMKVVTKKKKRKKTVLN